MRVEIGRLTPDRIDRETQMAICDMWSGAESLTDGKKTDPGLMCIIYGNNSTDNLGVRRVGGILEFMWYKDSVETVYWLLR